jgi:cell division protein FtsB
MSEATYNDQSIAEYLLGSLPAAEAERYDELSVTDDEFAAALSAREKDLVDAYVQGELFQPLLERFESYYLASPRGREKLEFAQAFKGWVEKSATAQTSAGDGKRRAEKGEGVGWSSGFRLFFAQRPALQWGTGFAALVLLCLVGWFVFENAHLRQQASQAQARRDELLQREQQLQKELEGQRAANATTEQELASLRAERERLEQDLKRAGVQQRAANIVFLVLVPPIRGPGRISTVTVLPQTEFIATQLELEPTDYSAYRVALIDPANNQTLWRSGNLKARTKGDGKAINISLPAGLLKPRYYLLRVSGIPAGGGSEIVSDYPLRVVR